MISIQKISQFSVRIVQENIQWNNFLSGAVYIVFRMEGMSETEIQGIAEISDSPEIDIG